MVDVGVLVMVLGTVVGCTPAPPKRQATPEPPETVSSQVFAPPSDSVSPDTGVAPPTSSVPVTSAAIYDCDAQPVERPAQFILLCGDAGETLVHLVWSGWGRTSASATGQVVVKSCTPDCADGTSIPYVATVTITGLSGGIYTKMHLSAPRAPVPAQNFAVDTDGPVALTRLPTGY
ncbi:MAG TPA: hypothetical protein VFX16_29250 [Pseudonocardiaceae bacterium]|nr:hypothetical protein [Pseudonocardiaceae bacterium]